VPVKIAGAEFKFIFDTGAPLMIDESLFDSLNLKEYRNMKVADVNENVKDLALVKIDTLCLGKTKFSETVALVTDFKKSPVSCMGVKGLIGSNMLRNSVVKIDLKNKYIIVTNKASKLGLKRKNGTRIELNRYQSTPIIEVEAVDGEKQSLILDTGDSDFFSLSMNYYNYYNATGIIERYIVAKGKGAESIGLYGSERDTLKVLFEFPEFKAFGHQFWNVKSGLTIDRNSRMGSAILNYGCLTIDYSHKRIFFESYFPGGISNCYETGFGMAFLPKDNCVVVGLVWKPGSAFDAGIKPGFTLKNAGGLDFENWEVCELFKLKELMDSNIELEFIFEDLEGNEITASMVKR